MNCNKAFVNNVETLWIKPGRLNLLPTIAPVYVCCVMVEAAPVVTLELCNRAGDGTSNAGLPTALAFIPASLGTQGNRQNAAFRVFPMPKRLRRGSL